MTKIFVKPVEGRRCKDPKTLELLPLKGKSVAKNGYWSRRLADGDCVLASEASPAPIKKRKVKKEIETPAEGSN